MSDLLPDNFLSYEADLSQYVTELTPEEIVAMVNQDWPTLAPPVTANESAPIPSPDYQNPSKTTELSPIPIVVPTVPLVPHIPTERRILTACLSVTERVKQLIQFGYRTAIPPILPTYLPGRTFNRSSACDRCQFRRFGCQRLAHTRCDWCTDANVECSYWIASGHPFVPDETLMPYAQKSPRCERCTNKKNAMCINRPCANCNRSRVPCVDAWVPKDA